MKIHEDSLKIHGVGGWGGSNRCAVSSGDGMCLVAYIIIIADCNTDRRQNVNNITRAEQHRSKRVDSSACAGFLCWQLHVATAGGGHGAVWGTLRAIVHARVADLGGRSLTQ